MNTVSFTPQPDGQIRVTIHSEGERDQSALITKEVFMEMAMVVTLGEDRAATMKALVASMLPSPVSGES